MKNYLNKTLGTIIFLLFTYSLNAQNDKNSNFTFSEINKKVKEFPDSYDLSSPLKSFISFKYLKSKGKQGLYRNINSFKIKGFFPKENAEDLEISAKKKESILDTKINQIIIYKDSVAGIFTDYQTPLVIITYLTFENGKWLNAGEDLGNNLEDARNKFKENADKQLENIYKIRKLKETHSDVTDLKKYLEDKSKVPEKYLLEKLSKHKIVIYGELHKRKSSWDLMKKVVNNPEFVKNVGIVFMELSSDSQAALDKFYNNKNLDTKILLDIFRNVQINGWYDKGMFEFLIELWKINHKLLLTEKIKIFAVDEPRPFNKFKTSEELKTHFDNILERNDQMCKIVTETLNKNIDNRNSLFIVGLGHAFKSTLKNMAIGSEAGKMKPTVASQITSILGNKNVFTIFQHIPIISNRGTILGKVRNGIFDEVFSFFGNNAIAFDLKDSPFGLEPFDALYEVSYEKEIGTYSENYDGYIFLEPLNTESDEYLFNNIITENYLKELKRRAQILETTVEDWFGIEKATVENLKEKIKSQPNKKRWGNL